MRYLGRSKLDPLAAAKLQGLTQKVGEADDAKTEASRLWGQKSGKAWKLVRQALAEMCSGIKRCMYCEDSAGTDIEHFYPKSDYPERAFGWDNYLLACSTCNSNYKRDEFPVDDDGGPLLIDPSTEDPFDHLEFSPSTGKYEHQDRTGEESRRVFGLDRPELVKARLNTWEVAEVLIAAYAKRKAADHARTGELAEAIRELPMSGVVLSILRQAETGPAAVAADCRRALVDCPEIGAWFQGCS